MIQSDDGGVSIIKVYSGKNPLGYKERKTIRAQNRVVIVIKSLWKGRVKAGAKNKYFCFVLNEL